MIGNYWKNWEWKSQRSWRSASILLFKVLFITSLATTSCRRLSSPLRTRASKEKYCIQSSRSHHPLFKWSMARRSWANCKRCIHKFSPHKVVQITMAPMHLHILVTPGWTTMVVISTSRREHSNNQTTFRVRSMSTRQASSHRLAEGGLRRPRWAARRRTSTNTCETTNFVN